MEIAMTLNSQSSTFNHFAASGVCRDFLSASLVSFTIWPALTGCLDKPRPESSFSQDER
jgi:hypothetical protein